MSVFFKDLHRQEELVSATHRVGKILTDKSGVVQQHCPLISWLHLTAQSFIASSAHESELILSVPVVSATSSTSCGRQSWHCRATSRRRSCSGRRLTFTRLIPWSSAWETPNPCCPTPLTPMKRWWSYPAPGNCPSTPTLSPSSSPSSPSPPRSVGTGPSGAASLN